MTRVNISQMKGNSLANTSIETKIHSVINPVADKKEESSLEEFSDV